MTSKFYTSLTKGLKLKVRKFWEISPTFVEVTRSYRGKTSTGGAKLLRYCRSVTSVTYKIRLPMRMFP